MVEQFNRTMEEPWKARIVEVEEAFVEPISTGGRVIEFDDDE
jgi:hypothetical protein